MNELNPQKYKLIVGLGNPDKKYEGTRHNVGFMGVDAFKQKYEIEIKQEKHLLAWCGKKEFAVNGVVYQLVLAKPYAYMNNSGSAVSKILHWYKLDPRDLLVVHDEVALDLGKIRISTGRSAAGHNGVESIIQSIGGKGELTRLRIGVGPDPGGDIRSDYVLGKFTNKELKVLEKVIGLSLEATEMLITNTAEEAMNKYNGMEIDNGAGSV